MGQGGHKVQVHCFVRFALVLTGVSAQVLGQWNAGYSHKLPVHFALEKFPQRSVFRCGQRKQVPVTAWSSHFLFYLCQSCSAAYSLWYLLFAALLMLREEGVGNHTVAVAAKLSVALPSHQFHVLLLFLLLCVSCSHRCNTCYLRIFSDFLGTAYFITHPPPLLCDKPFLVSGTSDSIEVLWEIFFREKMLAAVVVVGSASVGVWWEFKFALKN